MDVIGLFDMLLHVDKMLDILFLQYGIWIYVILFSIIFAETGLVIFPFLPGDTLIFIAGAFCATWQINFWIMNFLLLVAAILGNTVNYWIGSALGHKVFTHDYKWINRNALQKTHEFFERHGGKTIVIARFVPIVRTFAPFVAGISEMSHGKFQLYNITGAFLWVVGLLTAGYFFGHIPIIRDHLSTIVLIGIGAALFPLLLGGLWKLSLNLSKKVH